MSPRPGNKNYQNEKEERIIDLDSLNYERVTRVVNFEFTDSINIYSSVPITFVAKYCQKMTV